VILIRDLRSKIEERLSKTEDKKIRKTAEDFVTQIRAVEKELYQVRNQSPKDKIAFPIKLNNRLSGLRANLEDGDSAPTKGYYEVYERLSEELKVHLNKLDGLLQQDLPHLNKELKRVRVKTIEIAGT
ncbi:MAG: glycosyl hydrolase, partial [Nitrospirales bacterium]